MRRANSPVVAGFDGSLGSLRALDLAASEAALREVPLRVVYVVESIDARPVTGPRRVATALSPREVLARAYQAAAHRHPGLEIDTDAVSGSPAAVLIRESAGACLTVVGHRGSGGFLGLAAGAVCTGIVARGHGPILVTRGSTPRHVAAPVVVGVDADAPAARAIDFAFAEAGLRGVPVHAVYAVRHARVGGQFAPARYDAGEVRQQAMRLLAEALAGWAERHPDVKVDLFVEHGLDPPATLLVASGDASLIVVGSPEQKAVPRQPREGVVATVIHHAGCPVAVVHPTSNEERP